jgi:hypothetical protein
VPVCPGSSISTVIIHLWNKHIKTTNCCNKRTEKSERTSALFKPNLLACCLTCRLLWLHCHLKFRICPDRHLCIYLSRLDCNIYLFNFRIRPNIYFSVSGIVWSHQTQHRYVVHLSGAIYQQITDFCSSFCYSFTREWGIFNRNLCCIQTVAGILKE